jgi:hypothetical protein
MKKTILITSILLIVSSVFAQNENSKSGGLSLNFVNGISIPNGGFEDFAKDGFNTELSLTKRFCDKLSIGFGAKHSSFNVRQDFGPVQGSRNQYTSTTFDMGPQFSLGSDKFAIELYGRTGLSVSSTPEIRMLQANTDIVTGKMDQQSMKALSARLGAKIKTELCTGLQLFVSSEYVTTLNSDINFYSKDLSKAIDAEGRIDPDLAGEIPFSTKSLNFSSLNVNFGVSIALGSCCKGKSSQRSSNPLYQESGNKGDNPMYQQRGGVNDNPMYQQNSNQGEMPLYEGANNSGGNTGGSSGTRATDYNSSRSNRSTSSSVMDNDAGNGSQGNATRAQDHNASRSNTSSSIERDNNNDKVDKTDTRAQDHNVSRSNQGVANTDNNGGNGNEGGNNRGVEATDYNSSRSNKADNATDSSGDDGNNEGGTKAQDYNSSRSNRRGVANTNEDNNGGTSGTKAQDYNSSRSNRRGVANTNEDNNESKAQDYNSSRSNKSDRLISNPNEGNSKATQAQDYNSSRSNRTLGVKNGDINQDGDLDKATNAQDYNSSRSNKESGVLSDPNDDIRISMTQAEKRKMIKKLKREERARIKKENKQLKAEQKKRKIQANSIY